MDMIVTTAGRDALINAEKSGTAPVVIHEIGVGTGKYTATENQTALVAETKRLAIVEGGSAGDNSIHVAYQDPSTDVYSVHEIGLFLEDGTLFAVTSQTSAILQKTATATALIVIDIAFANIDVSSLAFGDVSFSNPGATTENSGVVTLATADEVAEGTNTQKAVTPATLLSRTATVERTGLVELATTDETTLGTDAVRAVTPAGTKAALDARAASGTETIAGLADNTFVTPSGLKALTATTARAGLIEIATEAEVTAGTDDARAVTPLRLKNVIESAVVDATETQKGIVELATTSEATTGTDATRAVTPAGVKAAITSALVDATETQKGIVELATTSEATTGTDTTRAVTPAGLKAAFRTVEITAGANIVNTNGNGNLSLYPSGQAGMMQAKTGTSQMSIARFSDDSPGASLVLFKSRATAVKATKSVQAGDNVGMINFIADNGNLDYTGTAIGARVAFINADVFESSTITSSGTTNLGIRGALRFYVCSDQAGRDGSGIELIDNTLRPTADGAMALGTSGRRYTNVYATNGTISTSDEREKTDIKPIDDAVLDAWAHVQFCQYRFKTGERIHTGVIAQRVAEAFEAEGLDAHDYGLFCEDTDEEGNVRYGIRYSEALALECALQRRETEKLKARIDALEKGAD